MPAKIKRPMTIKEYCALEEPRCSYCYSDEIVGGSIQIDGNIAWQPITCVDCGKKWNDIYTIAAYEPVG